MLTGKSQRSMGLRMNWRRGLLRVWAVLSVLWVAIVGFVAYPDVFYQYGLTKTRNAYDVALPDGRAIKVISPTDAGAAALAEVERNSPRIRSSPRIARTALSPVSLGSDSGRAAGLPSCPARR